MKKSTFIVAAAITAALAGGIPAAAGAEELTTGHAREIVSLPYIEDVNPSGSGYTALVEVCGRGRALLKVTSGAEKIKIKRLDARTWQVHMKRGKAYRIAARSAHGGAWQAIGYTIF
ncbi:MAG: hypothetical protein IKO55_03535 [Kiritimatiellae bacterium]|nr:hypothetical protein [Kiritimatiellia bacterium]